MAETILEALEMKRGFVLDHECEGRTFDAAESAWLSGILAEEPLEQERQEGLLAELVEGEARLVAHLFQDPDRLRASLGSQLDDAAVESASRLFATSIARDERGQHRGARSARTQAMVALGVRGRKRPQRWLKSHRTVLQEQQGEVLARYERTRATLVETSARLVDYVIRRYVPAGLFDSLAYLYGLSGLARAIDLFDFAAGAKLATYARWWIHAMAARPTLARSAIRWPDRWHARRRQVATGAADGASWAADYARLSAPARNAWFWPGSVTPKAVFELFDPSLMSPAHREAREHLVALLRKLLAETKPKYRSIIERRYGLDGRDVETLSEIGEDFGVSRERIRQLEAKELERLRKPSVLAALQELLACRPANATCSTAPSSES